jgi:4-coumarate--CoA ligase
VQVTHINVVPPIALELLRNPIARNGDFSSVQCLVNAAAPLKQNLADELSKRLNCVITQWYGMTEASPSVISQREDEAQVKNTVGRLLPGMELKIVDENGKGKSTCYN